MTNRRHALLSRLDVLVGTWDLTAIVDGTPVPGDATTTFAWAADGSFLTQRSEGKTSDDAPELWRVNSPFPTDVTIGLDDGTGEFTMLYADGRDVFRVYRMTFSGDGIWRIWRDAEGFNQRFTGQLSEDGNTIKAFWEFSEDGQAWRHDFDLVHVRR